VVGGGEGIEGPAADAGSARGAADEDPAGSPGAVTGDVVPSAWAVGSSGALAADFSADWSAMVVCRTIHNLINYSTTALRDKQGQGRFGPGMQPRRWWCSGDLVCFFFSLEYGFSRELYVKHG
jgi:hypothetical protein